MKTFKHYFTALFMLLCSAAVSAQNFEVDGVRYNVTNKTDKTVEVVSSNTKYTGSVVIPDTVSFGSLVLKESFDSWTSTNHTDGSTSEKSYTIDAEADDILAFDWEVSSEGYCDCLIVMLDGVEVLNKSGSQSGSYSYTFDAAATHTLTVKYTKDGSVAHGSDQCRVYNVSLNFVGDDVTTYSVTSIGSYAFQNCKSLTSIEIPNSVTSIGSYAFSGCSGLTGELVIPDGVTSIEGFAFSGCTGLTGELVIPDGVTSIEGSAFSGCTGLTSIEIPNSVTSIGSSAFRGCTGLTSIEIPSSVTSIDGSAFSGCTGLTNISVAAGNAKYDSRDNCNVIIETATNKLVFGCKNTVIPDEITSIGSYAFSGCTGLTSIEIPSSVTSIGSSAFSGCTGLRTVTSNATTAPYLDGDAFDTDRDMVLNYPEGSNYIAWGKYFSNFGYLSKSGYDSNNNYYWNEWVSDNQGNSIVTGEGVLYPPTDIQIRTLEIGEGITSICEYFQEGNSSLERVYFPESLTAIDNNAFSGCSSLKNVILPTNLITIGDYAFNGTAIDYIVIPNRVESIGDYAFYRVDNMGWSIDVNLIFKSISAPIIGAMDGYVTIYYPSGSNDYSFNNMSCNSYDENAQYCESWNNEGKDIFVFGNVYFYYDYQYENINNVVFHPDATDCGFITKCPNIKSVDVWDSKPKDGRLYTIKGSNAIFTYVDYGAGAVKSNTLCAGCKNTVIPEGTTNIAGSAFYGCSGLTNVEIPNSVTSIGWHAFQNCTGLTSITIPNASIDYGAFNSCTGLKEVTIGDGVKGFNYDAFSGCSGVETLNIGKAVSSGLDNSSRLFGSMPKLERIVIDEGNTHYKNVGTSVVECANNKLLIAFRDSDIPSTIEAVGSNAFYQWSGLDMDITVPASVKSVDENAFAVFNNVHFEAEEPVAITGNIFGQGAIYVPSSTYEAYCAADVWSEYKDRIVTDGIADMNIEVEAREGVSGVLEAIGQSGVKKVVNLKVDGTINSYDIIVFRDKMPLLNNLDLSGASVVASSKTYYGNTYKTDENSFGGYAFYDLDKLRSVKLPKDLVKLGDYTFAGCEKLQMVDASATNGLEVNAYSFKDCVALTQVVFPENVSEVSSYAFQSCGKLQGAELHNVAGSIKQYAFIDCASMKNLSIGCIDGNIERDAFKNCSALETIAVGEMKGNLNDYALNYCNKLTSVEFGKGPAVIGSRIFENSPNVKSFVAGEGTTEVKSYAFSSPYTYYQSKKLATVVLPSTLKKIGASAFEECSLLSNFVMPENVISIGNRAFYSCSSLIEMVLPDSVKAIGNETFKGCSSLKSVEFPKELLTIGANAFDGCRSLEVVKLPPTVTALSDNAFSNCTALVEMRIPSSLRTIGDAAFAGCNKLNSVYTYTIEPTVITENTFSTFATAKLYVPATSFWNYFWDNGWSKFNEDNFVEFDEPYEYFYVNNDYVLNDNTGYIEGKDDENPDADLGPEASLEVEGEQADGEEPNQSLGDVNVESNGETGDEGSGSSIIGDNNLFVENLHINITVKGGRWYFFAFPFDIKFDRISMKNGSDYVFRYYDGEERSKNGKGNAWKNVNESHLKAARGYIFQSSADDVLVLNVEGIKFKKEDKYNELVAHMSENMNDASWNFTGNPYLCYYDMANTDYTAPVTVWDGTKYVAIRPGDDDYHFAPYEAFFVQKPEGQESIGFDGEEQMTKTQSKGKKEKQAAARRARGIDPERLLINLVIGNDFADDRTRVVFNEKSSLDYEMACDASKFETDGALQIYTMKGNVRYAINERPKANGSVNIGYTAVEGGYYTIEAARMDTQVFLYDAETETMHNLADGAYRFYTEAGTFEKRFSLGMRDDETTAITEAQLAEAVVAVDGGISFAANVNAVVYNASGVQVAAQQGEGVVYLPAGTYVVCVGEVNTKVVVK